jgi:hypothetical protein
VTGEVHNGGGSVVVTGRVLGRVVVELPDAAPR